MHNLNREAHLQWTALNTKWKKKPSATPKRLLAVSMSHIQQQNIYNVGHLRTEWNKKRMAKKMKEENPE